MVFSATYAAYKGGSISFWKKYMAWSLEFAA